MSARLALLLAGCTLAGAALGSTPDEKLRSLMEQARARATGTAAGRPADERLAEREALLALGETSLRQGNVEGAQRAFERAASIQHAADSELGLVRSYMQAGEYRRALAFVAHTAAAHHQAAGGAALYAWLLHAGGQQAAATRLLDEAQGRLPGDPVFAAVRSALRTGLEGHEQLLLRPPARLAPYGASAGLPVDARVAGSGVLVDGGRRALVPMATLGRARSVWVRNALGALSRAVVERRIVPSGLALLRLETPLPAGEGLVIAGRDPFPGSVAFTVEYAASTVASATWPQLGAGFLGHASAGGARRPLGIELPRGPRGGPVFDAAGRLAGVAVRDDAGDRIVPASQLRDVLGAMQSPEAAQPPAQAPIDLIYESALRTTLQVIVMAGSSTARTMAASRH